jgi:hypothetical protein
MADYTRWANRDTRRSFSGFLQESGQFLSGDPAMIANQKGWTGDNFGWYRDNTGQVVARSIGGKMVVYDGSQGGSTPATTDMGNPAITAGQTPAERARTMGLQSNGKGGYVDDQGNVAARTVNGELVFYDDKGGAISDGAGGQALTQSSPSWVDPDTGLILVPPAQPETPEEKASTPDPLPATPPMGFDLFITQKHKGAKARAQAQRAADGDIAAQEQEVQQAYMEMGADTLQMKFQALIERGAGSGKKRSEYISNALMDSMNQNVEKYKENFETIDPELHDQLQQLIIKQALGQAKKDFYTEFIKDKMDEARKLKDWETYELLNDKFNTSDHDTAQREINNMMDDAQGIKEIKSGKFETLSGGLYTDYELKEVDNPGATLMGGGLDGEELWELKKEADNTAREYGLKNPKQIITVEWGVADEGRGVNPRKVALDALSAWRTEVLPDLPVGAILHNIPAEDERLGAGNKRERIYRLAGFGADSEKYKGMYGIVVVGEDGKKKLVPVDMEKTGEQQEMPEQMIYDLIFDVDELKEETINNIYEALMG